MMRASWLPLLLLLACSRQQAKVGPDLVDAAREDSAVAEVPLDRFMVGARIVDARARAIAHELQKKPPTFAEVDRTTAFVVHEGVVRAYDSHTGVERWHAEPPRCQRFAMTEHAVYCAGDEDVYALGKTDGSMRKIVGSKPIAQLFALPGHLIVLRAAGVVQSYPEGSSTPVATITAGLHAYRPLVADHDGFCGGAASGKGSVFAGCWSATLRPRWPRTITIAKPGDPPMTGCDVRRIGKGFLVAGTMPWGTTVERAVVVRLLDGDEVARVDDDVAAVASKNEREIDGLISLKKGLRYLEPNGTVRFMAKVRVDDSADALLDGERVYVATYPMISSGATLYTLDRKTGALLWSHTPPMPSIAHSAYMNDVQLTIMANTLVMRGHEAGVEYASLLDRASGTAYLNTVLPLWGP